jgi:hypothetical protein
MEMIPRSQPDQSQEIIEKFSEKKFRGDNLPTLVFQFNSPGEAGLVVHVLLESRDVTVDIG